MNNLKIYCNNPIYRQYCVTNWNQSGILFLIPKSISKVIYFIRRSYGSY